MIKRANKVNALGVDSGKADWDIGRLFKVLYDFGAEDGTFVDVGRQVRNRRNLVDDALFLFFDLRESEFTWERRWN